MLEGSGLNPEVSEYGNQYDIYGYTPFFIDSVANVCPVTVLFEQITFIEQRASGFGPIE